MKPLMLMILDGWGIAPAGPYNAAKTAQTPQLAKLFQTYPHTRLQASGNAVGLPRLACRKGRWATAKSGI